MDIYKAYVKPDAENRDLVKIGRIVSFGALLIAVLVAPKLNSLDSAFQYIQEYTGYIYPGVVAVFAMGMFWKQITANAALWTAIVTIPLGILIKLLFPEMPFILRMGYVFIGLCFIATSLTFIEKRHRVKNDSVVGIKAKSLIRTGHILIALGVICLILGAALIQSLINLGFESIFMLATLFIMLGFILIWNVKLDFKDHKAINVNYDNFKTGAGFNLGAIAIVAIITVLYVLFW
jgi:solute:Na+ symporter, SSS family